MQLLIAFVQKGFPGIPSYKKDIFEKPTLYTVKPSISSFCLFSLNHLQTKITLCPDFARDLHNFSALTSSGKHPL